MTTLRPSAITTFTAHGLSQAPHLVQHFIRFGASEAEHEALADMGARVSGREGPQPKAFLPGAGRNLLIGQPGRKRDYQVHAGFGAQYFHLGAVELWAELFPQGLREGIAAFRIQLPGLPDVPREMTSADEIGKRCLIEVGRAKIVGLANREKPAHQSGWNHHVSEAQRRKEHLY